MYQFERIYHLERRIFTISKHIDYFPVETIVFSSHDFGEVISGILKGSEISSGRFIGKFIEKDQVQLFFQWFDSSLSLIVSGKLWGFICGNPSDKLQLFLNWSCVRIKTGNGVVSYTELK